MIKIEHPTRGGKYEFARATQTEANHVKTDDTRAWGPPYAKYVNSQEGPGESAYYLGVSMGLRKELL